MMFRRSTAAFFVFGALAMGSSVGLAAFAFHGLGQTMGYPPEKVTTFFDATLFQADHAVAILLIGLLCQFMADGLPRRVIQLAGVMQCAAILMFSGSVYALTFDGFGELAPVGGFSSMIGWLVFAAGAVLGAVKGDIRVSVSVPRPQAAE
jgi:uncharacterized membrane protein YgdD (TMEM256/DUF423 family)